MIYLESYKDKALEIPNGFFAWHDTTGRIDGKFQKSINHTTNTIVFGNGEIANLTKEITDTADIHPPIFKGGVFGWIKYLEQNLVPPKRLYNISSDNTRYTVVVDFKVNVLGEVGDIFLFNSCEWSSDMEAIRVLNKSPKWIPALNKGYPDLSE